MKLIDRRVAPLALTPGKQALMIDDDAIAESSGVSRLLGRPVDLCEGPVFRPEMPWEGRCVILWGSVLWDDDDALFKMWYVALHPDRPKDRGMTLLCYAYSRDGLSWNRPSLGLQEWDGSTKNNILMGTDVQLDTPTVYLDPNAQAKGERFKMLLHHRKLSGFCLYTSEDGVRWRSRGSIRLNARVGDRHTLMLDPISREWRVYHKIEGRPRTIWMATSPDLEHWEEHGEVLVPDANDPPETEFYGLYGFAYEGYRLGFLEVFDVLQRRLRTELVTLDEHGVPERFEPRHRFMNAGGWGRWNYAWTFPSHNPPIRVGEELWVYYHGRQTLHWSMPPLGSGHIGAVGLAKLRPAGFACLAARQEGTLTTRPFAVKGHALCINADAAGGEVRCELLDDTGNPLPGFAAADFYPLQDDATFYKCNWSGSSQLAAIPSPTVRLRVHLNAAKFYSFWLIKDARS